MSETVVRVDLRQATLTEHARLRDAGELVFLAMENPPPVRSLLRVTVADEVRAVEVARVVEVVDEAEAARGCYGRAVELERLAEQDRVGSEHLEVGLGGGGGGVPAPVVIMNTHEMMLDDLDNAGEPREPERDEQEPERDEQEPEPAEQEPGSEPGSEAGSEPEPEA